jgi:hypothetical protein
MILKITELMSDRKRKNDEDHELLDFLEDYKDGHLVKCTFSKKQKCVKELGEKARKARESKIVPVKKTQA